MKKLVKRFIAFVSRLFKKKAPVAKVPVRKIDTPDYNKFRKIKYKLITKFDFTDKKKAKPIHTKYRTIYANSKVEALSELRAKHPNRIIKIGLRYYKPIKAIDRRIFQ